MIFHENGLPADDSHEIYLIFQKLRIMSQNLSSAAVVIGALRVKNCVSGRSAFPKSYKNLCRSNISYEVLAFLENDHLLLPYMF